MVRSGVGGRASRLWLAARLVAVFGMLFGVTVTLTDASWTDQELATGSFQAATFVTQSSVDTANPPGAATWASHASAPATLSFSTAGLLPGAVVRAPLAIRVVAGSAGGHVSVAYASSTGSAALLAALQLAVYVDTSNGCVTSGTPGSGGSWIVGGAGSYQSGLTSSIAANSTALPAAADGVTPGQPVYYCFIVMLPSTAVNSLQGTTATATWVLNAST